MKQNLKAVVPKIYLEVLYDFYRKKEHQGKGILLFERE